MKKLFLSMTLVMSMGLLMTSCGEDEKKPEDCTDCPIETEKETTMSEVDSDVEGKTLTTVTIEDFGKGTGTITLSNKKVYILEGKVFVNEGQTLTIEEGTIIKGTAGQGAEASALVVARGGKIMAEGTADMPIIMTTAADDIVRYSDGTLEGGDKLNAGTKGLWGGLIVLGNATITNNGETAVEGIPTTEVRGLYGGSNDADNSGVIKYVSIRHGGTEIGAGNEINGLTLGGVGSGTTIDYVEIYANNDDGIEFFGGSVGVKHALVSYSKDDSFDYDEGYHGKGQFWVTLQSSDSDRGGEHDGGPSDCETCMPIAKPVIYNATYIGNGSKRLITFRDNAGGEYHNSIFANWSKGIDIENTGSEQQSRKRLEDGDLKIMNNVFDGVAGNDLTKLVLEVDKDAATVIGDLLSATNVSGNTVATTGVTATAPVPATELAATAATDSWFTAAPYKGAFSGSNWAAGWTKTFPTK